MDPTVHDPAVLARHRDGVAVPLDVAGPCALEQVHAAPQELLLERGGHFGVLEGKHLLA